MEYLLDTSILIRHLRRHSAYTELMQRLAQEGDLAIAAFTRVEIVRGMRDHEREDTFLLLDSLFCHPLDVETADLAGELLRSWQRRGVVLSGPDAIIAATALHRQATLVTTNPRHFPMSDLNILDATQERT